MKKGLLLSVSFLLFLSVQGCVQLEPYYYGTYDIEVTNVERPAKVKERYGEMKCTPTKEGDIQKFFYADSLLSILWVATSRDILFTLENKTDHSIQIVWDEASFIDDKGGNHRVMHSGVKYTDRNSPQPPTIIARKGKIDDQVVPTDYVYFDEGYYSQYYTRKAEWKQQPFFVSYQRGGDISQLELLMKGNVGKTFQVLLPIKFADTVNEYIFTFEVKKYEIKGKI